MGSAVPPGPQRSGVIRLRLPSRLLDRDVGLRVYVPAAFDAAQRHPVLYVQDGQNVFEAASESPSGQSWQLDVTLDRLVQLGLVTPPIVVAIDHAGAARVDEFTPTRDHARRRGGRGPRYARFLVEELKPFVDQHFPSEPWTASTVLAGSSMGALVTLTAGLQYPDTFGALGVMSPSIWWDHRAVLRSVRARVLRPRPRVWLDVGMQEPARAVDDTRALRRALVREGWQEPRSLRYDEDPDGDHGEGAWARRVEPMLRFLIPPRPQAPTAATTRAGGGPGLR